MGLKYKIAKLEDVPEAVRSLYVQKDDHYVLDAEGVVEKEKLDEFRNNNINLQKQLDKLKDVDPVKYAELMALDRQVREGELIKAGKVEEAVNLRVEGMKTDYESKITTLTQQNQTAMSQLGVLLIDNAVKGAAIKAGVQPTAVDDIVLRARGTYQIIDGAPVPKDQRGEVMYGKDGKSPMPMDEWVLGLKKTAPHLFQGSQGSGANGGGTTGHPDVSKLSPTQKIQLGLGQPLMAAPPQTTS